MNTHGITLRSLVPFLSGMQRAIVNDAAREVDRLQTENERMRAALHRIIELHDRVDLVEAQSIAESAFQSEPPQAASEKR